MYQIVEGSIRICLLKEDFFSILFNGLSVSSIFSSLLYEAEYPCVYSSLRSQSGQCIQFATGNPRVEDEKNRVSWFCGFIRSEL